MVNRYIFAQEEARRLVKEEYPELTDTESRILSQYVYINKLDGLQMMMRLGGCNTTDKSFLPIITKGIENFVYDQSSEVIEIVKKIGEDIDHNLDTLKSMLMERETESEDTNTDKEICKKCMEGGCTCCMALGCELCLEDIKEEYRNVEGFKKLIDTGLVVLDWWEDDEIMGKTYYLRIKNLYDGIRKVNPSFGGHCILLGEEGCMLSYGIRPKISRDIIPSATGQCIPETDGDFMNSKMEAANSFLPVQDELEEVLYSYR